MQRSITSSREKTRGDSSLTVLGFVALIVNNSADQHSKRFSRGTGCEVKKIREGSLAPAEKNAQNYVRRCKRQLGLINQPVVDGV
jgi:hypothetical protein